jgi:hypothetical protein
VCRNFNASSFDVSHTARINLVVNSRRYSKQKCCEINKMKLITVHCFPSQNQEDDEPRVGVVIAHTAHEAEELCRGEYATEGYSRFEAKDAIEGAFPGPARLIGYAGQHPAFSWKP